MCGTAYRRQSNLVLSNLFLLYALRSLLPAGCGSMLNLRYSAGRCLGILDGKTSGYFLTSVAIAVTSGLSAVMY